jgi:DnaJ-class molecular chaperone
MKNYFKILEVDPGASSEVIEKAYKALCMKYHPDKHPPQRREWATRKMQELNEAYRVVRDPDRRMLYAEKVRLDLWQVFLNEGLIGLTKFWLGRS